MNTAENGPEGPIDAGTGDDGMDRRRFLGAMAAAGVPLGVSGTASARPGPRRGRGGGFPPAGITEWGTPVVLGNGRANTFTTVTPSGRPKSHGLYLERDALEGLPSGAELVSAAEADSAYRDKYGPTGESIAIHGRQSLEFFMPFPATGSTPFTFLGLNWNPDGHPGPGGAWDAPHFDVHFHMLPTDVVDAIDGPTTPAYDDPDPAYVPEGYRRDPDPTMRVITDMGEHMAPASAPEFDGGTFTNTLVWGLYDPDGDGTPELTFVEPMVTRDYLSNHSGVDRRPVPQPDAYVRSGPYPTAYSVRTVPGRNALAVVLHDFVAFEGED